MLATPLPITRQRRLFCLLAHRGILIHHGVGVLSSYPSWHAPSGSSSSLLLWVVCHPSRTFPPKEPEWEPQNRLSSLPTTRPYSLLPLTHNPPLLVLAGYRLVMSGPYACSTPIYIQNLSAAHVFAVIWRLIYVFCLSSLTSYGVNCFLISHSLQLASFKG